MMSVQGSLQTAFMHLGHKRLPKVQVGILTAAFRIES